MARKKLDKREQNVVKMTTRATEGPKPSTIATEDTEPSSKKAPHSPRRKRVPLSGADRIAPITMPGFRLRYVDAPMINRRLANGYEFVTYRMLGEQDTGAARPGDATSMDSKVTIDAGGGQIQHLMRLPIEDFEEDQRDMQKRIRETERAIYKKDGATIRTGVRTTAPEPRDEE